MCQPELLLCNEAKEDELLFYHQKDVQINRKGKTLEVQHILLL